MAFESITLGLTIQVPTSGTQNYAAQLKALAWNKISQHSHTGSGDGNPVPTGGVADYAITTVKLSKNYGHTQATTVNAAGTAATLDFNTGNVQKLDLSAATGAVLVTLSNPASGSSYRIFVIQGGTLRDVTWPGNVLWPQGQKLLVSDINNTDMVELYYDGTNYYGTWEVDFS